MRPAMDTARALVAAQMVEVVSGDPQLLVAELQKIETDLEQLPTEQALDMAQDIIVVLSRLAAFIAAFPSMTLRDVRDQHPDLELPEELTGWLDHPQSVLQGAFTLVARMEQERFD